MSLPVKNQAFTTYISVIDQNDTASFRESPTIAAGDFKVATDDGAPANPATIPVFDADFAKRIKIVLSASEMNGDAITIIASDAAGAEWADYTETYHTTVVTVDELLRSANPGNTVSVDSDGNVQADVRQINDVTLIGDGDATPFNVV